MTALLWLTQINASLDAHPEGAPASSRPAIDFSDFAAGFRQYTQEGAGDHTFAYGFLVIVALAVVSAYLAHLLQQLRFDRASVVKAPAPSLPQNIRIMCPNAKCRSLLVVPVLARGKIVQCSKCKRLVKVPLLPPVPPSHLFGAKRKLSPPPHLAGHMPRGSA